MAAKIAPYSRRSHWRQCLGLPTKEKNLIHPRQKHTFGSSWLSLTHGDSKTNITKYLQAHLTYSLIHKSLENSFQVPWDRHLPPILIHNMYDLTSNGYSCERPLLVLWLETHGLLWSPHLCDGFAIVFPIGKVGIKVTGNLGFTQKEDPVIPAFA